MQAGTLRIGINFGNVVLARRDAAGAPVGIAVDLANELVRRLEASMELVTYDAAGKMAEDAKAGAWDAAFLAVDPERANEIVFTSPYLEVEATYLVPAPSPLQTVDDVDRDGIRVAVSSKSAYDLFLTRSLQRARLVRAAGPDAAVDLFFTEKLDALAGLRPWLSDLAKKHDGVRLLDGRFYTVQQAIGVPRGRDDLARTLQEFVQDVKASGYVSRLIAASGIPGVVALP